LKVDKKTIKEEGKIEEDNKNEENLVAVQTSSFSKIFCCCKPKNEGVDTKMLDLIKLLKPLMTLSLSQNTDLNLHIIRRMLLDFSKAYMKIEEGLLKELNTFAVNQSVNNESGIQENNLIET